MLHECDDRESPRDGDFYYTLSFFIQIYNLPLPGMSLVVGRYLGAHIDVCLDVKMDRSG